MAPKTVQTLQEVRLLPLTDDGDPDILGSYIYLPPPSNPYYVVRFAIEGTSSICRQGSLWINIPQKGQNFVRDQFREIKYSLQRIPLEKANPRVDFDQTLTKRSKLIYRYSKLEHFHSTLHIRLYQSSPLAILENPNLQGQKSIISMLHRVYYSMPSPYLLMHCQYSQSSRNSWENIRRIGTSIWQVLDNGGITQSISPHW
jgi:hypothetical protein